MITGFETRLRAAAAAVDLALGRPVAPWTAWRPRRPRGDAGFTLPARAQLVDAALEAGDAALAQDAAQRIADLAAATGTALHRAHRDHAAGKVALARGGGEATGLLRSAALGFAQTGATGSVPGPDGPRPLACREGPRTGHHGGAQRAAGV